ncbi:hypothetical protein [Streptomyces sp.]|uniref:hypothetical protein n=1 Tax=Streptomyces sp. TaxID=1931 RepID=UPI002D6A0815|nr:hypothetical protein [Streptomyces sp.]HZF88585.1 hypothetical protein [Streptomyces sp.]
MPETGKQHAVLWNQGESVVVEFLRVIAGFPALPFTAALVVVVGFWLLVLLGAAGHDSFDADVDTDALNLGGVPVSVSASLLIVTAWLFTVTGSVLLDRTGWPDALAHLLGTVLLCASVFGSWRLTRAAVRPLSKLFPDESGPSRNDVIGPTHTLRTGRVDADFGRTEVAARDGSTAVVFDTALDRRG